MAYLCNGILMRDLKIVASNDYKLDVENEYAEFWRVSQLEVIILAPLPL